MTDGDPTGARVPAAAPAGTYSPGQPGSEERTIGREAVHSFDPEALVRLRRARGLSHDALAELVDSARPTLIAYEKGTRTPGPATLLRLATALDVDVLDLTTTTLEQAGLADLRARVGLSKTEISARLGMARHTLDRIERGVRQLEPATAEALAAVFGVDAVVVGAAYERSRSRS